MLIERLWCRECGGPLLPDGIQVSLEGHAKFNYDDLRWNNLMVCPGCLVGEVGEAPRPDSSRIERRLLFHLITTGIARVGYTRSNEPWYDPPVQIHEMTIGHEGARNYLGAAVRQLRGLWVGSHHRPSPIPHMGYVIGHLKTVSTPCHCEMM